MVWGLYFGVILMMEKIGLLRLLEKAPVFLRHLYTMLLVMLSWAIFAFDSLGQGVQFIGALFGGGGRLWDGQGVYLLYSSAVLLVLLILGSTGPSQKSRRLGRREAPGPSCRIYRSGARPYPGGLRALCGLSGGRIL